MRNKAPARKATWREYAQGGLIGGVFAASLAAVASQCIQLDTPPKVADYYEQYRDYRDQYNRLMAWKERVETGGIGAFLPGGLEGAIGYLEGQVELAKEVYTDALESAGGDYASAAVQKTGPLTRIDSDTNAPADDPDLCFKLEMGADIGEMARTGEPNNLAARCGPAGQQDLADLSVRPSHDGAGMAPNTAQSAEVTRSVMEGQYGLLDVVRGDLAWLRDHPGYHEPFRYPRAALDIPVEEIAQHSASLQRVAAIMAGRGFAAEGYAPYPAVEGLATDEARYDGAGILARLEIAYDGMARYATVYPKIAAMRDTLLDIDTATIDSANEGERYGIGVQLAAKESEMTLLRVEATQREERLQGVLLAEYLNKDVDAVIGGQP